MEALLIQSLTVGELKNLVRNEVTDLLKEHFTKEEIPKRYISRKEAAGILDCSLNTIDDWTLKGYLIAYKFGSTIKYLKHEVEQAGPNIIRRRKSGGRHA